VEIAPGYNLRQGSTLDRALLLKFMRKTYQEMSPSPNQDFSHLVQTVEQYLSLETPLFWIDVSQSSSSPSSPVASLWMGNAIDQVTGKRNAHIFMLYVLPEHRRRGIGKSLMHYAQNWATQRGDSHISLQVFTANTAALNLYNQLGYQTQSLWMVKTLG
jgi:ribosomal protein S18 acetylase RimI-like enzyme